MTAATLPHPALALQADQAGDGAELRDLATLVDGDAIQVDLVVDHEAAPNDGLIGAMADLLIDLYRRRRAAAVAGDAAGAGDHEEDSDR